MVRKELVSQIKEDFKFLENDKRVLAVLLFGSQLDESLVTIRSDIDICVVAPSLDDPRKLLDDIFRNLKRAKYDVKIFEMLPLYLKIDVIMNHYVIFAKDLPQLYEYFYFYRKIWKDQAYRNKVTRDELLRILERRKLKI